MMRYFNKALGAYARTGRTLYVLTICGVALGVASVLSIQIINRNALAAFAGSVTAVSGEADLTILGNTPSFPERFYPLVLSTPGVQAAWPLFRGEVSLGGHNDMFLDIVGVDIFTPTTIPWQGEPTDLSAGLSTAGWVAATPTLAKRMRWAIGNRFQVTHGSRHVDLVIGALVDFETLSPLASPNLMVMDIAQAQSLFGRPGNIHQIDVQLSRGATPGQMQERLQAKLGDAVRVVTPEQRAQQAEGLLAAFRLNLTALSLISLFVGMFLVYSSTQASLVRRRAEFGLLRSLGATRRQVFGLIMSEVVLLGGFGVMLGLPLGYAVAQANVDMVSKTLTNLYLLEEISRLEMTWWLYALGVVIGVGGAMLGALLPALDMSRRDTRSLLASVSLHETFESLAPYVFVAGLTLLATAGLWYWGLGYQWKHAGFVLGVALLIALPLLTPLVIREVCGRVRLQRFRLAYSLKGLAVHLQVTSVAVASLAVAVSMLISITLLIGSFRQTLAVWIGTSIQADVYVSPASWRGKGSAQGLEPHVIATLSHHPAVRAVDRLRRFRGYTGDRRIGITGVEMGLDAGVARFPLVSGDPKIAYRKVAQEGAIFMGETLARTIGLWTGDDLPLYTPGGVKTFPIAAVYYDYSPEGGMVAMDLHTMIREFGPGPINSIALYLKPGYNAMRVIDDFKAALPQAPLEMRSNARLRRDVLRIFDQTFAVTKLLQVMSLLIAGCGIALMLLVLAREQASELALYQSLGATRWQLFGVFVGKGLGMGLMGILLGLMGGVVLAGILIYVINRAYFGWTIQPYLPLGPILQQLATIVIAAILASVYPALRASRMPATELSRDHV
jgi:putative ABC transport system permease protein